MICDILLWYLLSLREKATIEAANQQIQNKAKQGFVLTAIQNKTKQDFIFTVSFNPSIDYHTLYPSCIAPHNK